MKRFTALALILIMSFLAVACSPGPDNPSPSATVKSPRPSGEYTEVLLNDDQIETLLRVVWGFTGTADFDSSRGMNASNFEGFLSYYYGPFIEPAEDGAYGLVSIEEADKLMMNTFGLVFPFRAEKDEDADPPQAIYADDEYYHIAVLKAPLYRFEFDSQEFIPDEELASTTDYDGTIKVNLNAVLIEDDTIIGKAVLTLLPSGNDFGFIVSTYQYLSNS